MSQKPPVDKGEEIQLQIEGLNHEGEGVGRYRGFTVFVPHTVPDDIVIARVISLHKNYARASLRSTVRRSAARVPPRCEHFSKCGGCQLQHIGYAEQLQMKRDLVNNALKRIAGLDVDVLPTVGMSDPWGYRHKLQAAVSLENGRIRAGFYEKRSHTIVDLKRCYIQHPSNEMALNTLRDILNDYIADGSNRKKEAGTVKHLLARTSSLSGQTLVVIITNSHYLPGTAQLTQALRQKIPGLCGVVQNINTRRSATILGRDNITLWGQNYLLDSIDGIQFRISPHSFFQVNPVQTSILYHTTKKYAALTGTEIVFDLYCGIGAISLYLARFAKKVIGVESVAEAVRDARKNAALNNISNTEFHTGLAEEEALKLIRQGYQADVIIVNPPRKGCERKLLLAILAMLPDRIVYISCNPATLARDLQYMSGHGYTPIKVQPVDMFPQTAHVECVVCLNRKHS